MKPFRKSLEALHSVIAAKSLSLESAFSEDDFAAVESPEYRDSLHEFYRHCRVDWPVFAERVQLAFDASPSDPACFVAELMGKLGEAALSRECGARYPVRTLKVRSLPHPGMDTESFAIGWMADETRPDLRAFKVTVFLYVCHGLDVFPTCRTLDDVIALHRVPRSTFYKFLQQLRSAAAGADSGLSGDAP